MARPRRSKLAAILRQRCPRCREGRIFKGMFKMNDPCPLCGLVFEREPGYFLGAMYISYAIGIVFLTSFWFLGRLLLPNVDPMVLPLLTMLPYLPLVPAVFRYSRVIWIHFDRTASPSEASSHEGWTRWREEQQRKSNPENNEESRKSGKA